MKTYAELMKERQEASKQIKSYRLLGAHLEADCIRELRKRINEIDAEISTNYADKVIDL